MTFRVPLDLYEQAKQLSEEADRSMGATLRLALRKYLENGK